MRKQITLAEAGDVMTTALEGGIGYWSFALGIERDDELNCTSYVLMPGCADHAAEFPPTSVTRQMVRAAWKEVAEGKHRICNDYLDQMRDATREPGDAGCVDAGVADYIVQVAVMGEARFG